ncbi:hypothetical protein [Adonisia turfae]
MSYLIKVDTAVGYTLLNLGRIEAQHYFAKIISHPIPPSRPILVHL